MFAQLIRLAGGVDVLSNFYNYTDYPNLVHTSTLPLDAGLMTASPTFLIPDPLASIAVPLPNTLAGGYAFVRNATVSYGTGNSATLTPGVYEDINIAGAANVTFSPGVYILSPTKAYALQVLPPSPATA